jgi:hypothetical protein
LLSETVVAPRGVAAAASLVATGAAIVIALGGPVEPWRGGPLAAFAGALTGLVLHEAAHLAIDRSGRARPRRRFVAATLAPAGGVAALALAIGLAVPALRAAASAAFVVNAAASARDLWIAIVVARSGCARARLAGRGAVIEEATASSGKTPAGLR